LDLPLLGSVSDDSSDCASDSEIIVRRERAQNRRDQKDANAASTPFNRSGVYKPRQRKSAVRPVSDHNCERLVWDAIAKGTGLLHDSVESCANLIPPTPTLDRHISEAIKFRAVLDNYCTNRQVCAVCSMYRSITDMYTMPDDDPITEQHPKHEAAADSSEVEADDNGLLLHSESPSFDDESTSSDSFLKDDAVSLSESDIAGPSPAPSNRSRSTGSRLASDYNAFFDSDGEVEQQCGQSASHHLPLLKKIRIPFSKIPNTDLLLASIPSTPEHPRSALTTYDLSVYVPPDAVIKATYCLQPFSIHPSGDALDPNVLICNECYRHLNGNRVPPDSLVCYDTGKYINIIYPYLCYLFCFYTLYVM
jgi:hypothetical protein